MKKTDKDFVLGIDVGGSNVRIGIVDNDLKLHEIEVLKSKDVASRFYDIVLEKYNHYKNIYNISIISIGFPGVVDISKKAVVSIPNRREFETKNQIIDLEKRINVPIHIDKDVNYLLEFDIYNNKIDRDKNILAFYIGTGLGNSMRINGEIFRGDLGAAGELGHISIPGNNELCGCGNIGCLESIASGHALRKIHERLYSNTIIDDIFVLHKEDDPIVEFVNNLAKAVALEIVIMDIHHIILGGGVIKMKDFPKEKFEELIKINLRSELARKKIKFYYAESNPQDGIIGAAIVALKERGNVK